MNKSFLQQFAILLMFLFRSLAEESEEFICDKVIFQNQPKLLRLGLINQQPVKS